MREHETFGTFMKQAREKVGLTQLAAAEKIGVSDGTIQNWEYAMSRPQKAYHDAIIETYGLDRMTFEMKLDDDSNILPLVKEYPLWSVLKNLEHDFNLYVRELVKTFFADVDEVLYDRYIVHEFAADYLRKNEYMKTILAEALDELREDNLVGIDDSPAYCLIDVYNDKFYRKISSLLCNHFMLLNYEAMTNGQNFIESKDCDTIISMLYKAIDEIRIDLSDYEWFDVIDDAKKDNVTNNCIEFSKSVFEHMIMQERVRLQKRKDTMRPGKIIPKELTRKVDDPYLLHPNARIRNRSTGLPQRISESAVRESIHRYNEYKKRQAERKSLNEQLVEQYRDKMKSNDEIAVKDLEKSARTLLLKGVQERVKITQDDGVVTKNMSKGDRLGSLIDVM